MIRLLDFGDHVPEFEKVYWFAILVAVNLQTSFLTPPFGFALFYIKGVSPASVRLQHIYRGIIPFGITKHARTEVDTLTIRIPIRLQRRGGRKLIVTPEGASVPQLKPARNKTLVKALVRAHRWRRRIESGQAKSITDLAEQENVTDAYVCRLLPLTCLAPDKPGGTGLVSAEAFWTPYAASSTEPHAARVQAAPVETCRTWLSAQESGALASICRMLPSSSRFFAAGA